MRRFPHLPLAAALALAVVAAGCSSDGTASSTTSSTTTATPKVTGTVTVSAAASLTEAFGRIKDGFERANPGVTVRLDLGSSGQLATQIQGGAPADVAAFADEAPMTTLGDAGLLAAPARIFARNELVIVTRPGNPRKITALSDLDTAGTVSLCSTGAPCGKFADQALQSAGVSIPAARVTRGPDVKATLTAVTEGDADAAIVYVTDAEASGSSVSTVDIPAARNVVASYPIAVVRATTSRSAATAFEDYVLGPKGQAVLQDAGFLAP